MRQAERISELYRYLFSLSEARPSSQNPSVLLRFNATEGASLRSVPGQEIWRSTGLRVLKTEGGFRLECGSSTANVDTSTGAATGFLDDRFWDRLLQDQRDFFFLCLVMLLRQHGLYGLHANGVTKGDRASLIVGTSGAGKTTLTIAMVRQGWSYVSDDAVLLREVSEGVNAVALRRGFACMPAVATHFPELGADNVPSRHLSDLKRMVDIDAIYPGSLNPECQPRVILFPKIVDQRHSQLVPMEKTSSLLSLIPQSAGIMTGGSLTSKQLEVLNLLVHQTSNYQLLAGNDIFEDPEAVSRLLWEA